MVKVDKNLTKSYLTYDNFFIILKILQKKGA